MSTIENRVFHLSFFTYELQMSSCLRQDMLRKYYFLVVVAKKMVMTYLLLLLVFMLLLLLLLLLMMILLLFLLLINHANCLQSATGCNLDVVFRKYKFGTKS